MAGNFLVCPAGSTIGESASGYPTCSTAWEIHHTDEFLNPLIDAINYALLPQDLDMLAAFFAAGLTAGITAYMTAWGCGKILGMFEDNTH